MSPAEVEEVLRAHPDVADVAVIGTPHPRWGEQVTAVVVRRDGAALDGDALGAFAGSGSPASSGRAASSSWRRCRGTPTTRCRPTPEAGAGGRMSYEQIPVEVDRRVATLTLNRPERRNAWTRRMGIEIRDALQATPTRATTCARSS